jgi:glutamate-5-semialdehyde dehydrogenase
MRRTGICGAAETLLVDRAVAATHLVPLLAALPKAGCEIRGDARCARCSRAKPATDADWTTEYLDAIISVKLVDGVGEAIAHIETYSARTIPRRSSPRTPAAVERFFNEIDSAILLHNASTQFADGGEFGMGAEIGIATGKMHARGPVGVEQLTSFKYRVRGSGQTDLVLPFLGDGQDLRLRPPGRDGRAAAGAHEGAGLDLHPRAAFAALVDLDQERRTLGA